MRVRSAGPGSCTRASSPAARCKMMDTVARRYRMAYRLTLLTIIGLMLGACTGQSPARSPAAAMLAVLTCHDSAGQQGVDTPPTLLVDGVDGFIGDSDAYDTLPVWRQGGHRYLAWKAALSVASTALPYRTVSVVSPASARLGYGGAPLSLRVRMPACGRRYTLYVGGIFITHPACVTLAVTGPSGKSSTVTMPVLVTRC
jgi:hypothetical protein